MEHNLSSRSADEREEFGQLCCHCCLRDWWWVVLGLCFQRNSYHTLLLLTPICCCYSLSHVTPWTAAHQASLFITISLNLLKLMSSESIMPSNHRLLCQPLLLLPFTFPRIRSFPMSRLFASGGQSIGASASVLPMNIQGWFPLGLFWSPCCSRDSQESSPTPQFKSINSSALRLLFGPTLTSIHDYWKNHSFDSMDLFQQSDISAFQYAV